jgi:hypothetical protein
MIKWGKNCIYRRMIKWGKNVYIEEWLNIYSFSPI